MVNAHPWIKFFPLWVLANLAGLFLTFLSGQIFYAVVLLVVFQWLAMRTSLGVDWTWMLASFPVYVGMFAACEFFRNVPASVLLYIFLTLGVLGILQWLSLRKIVPRAILWTLISTIAGIFAWTAWYLLNGHASSGDASPIVFWLEYIAIYSVITGIGLIVLNVLPKPSESSRWF